MIKSVVIKSSDYIKESENVSDEGTSRNREEWKDAKHSIHSLARALIGPEYSGASEDRLFLLQVRGRNSIECAKVPRLVVLRLR